MQKIKSLLTRQNITFLVIIAIMAVLPVFLEPYPMQIMINAELYMIFAMSLNLLMGIGGTVSFGHVAFFSIGAYTTACLWKHFGFNYGQSFIFVILVTGLAGLLLALPMSRITGRYVTIITLSFAEIVKLILEYWEPVTLGNMGIVGIPQINLFGLRLKTKAMFFYFALILVIVTYVCMYWFVHSKLGRNVQAMRDDSIAAEAMGIKLFPNKVITFTVSAIFAGIAGSLYAHVMTYVDPGTFENDMSFYCISMVVLGGLGNFSGTMIGALFLTILPEYLRRFQFIFQYRMVVYGLVLVIVMWLNHSIPGDRIKKKAAELVENLFNRRKAEVE